MALEAQVVAFEGGSLRALASGEGREAVLGLPLSRLLLKMVRVPAEADPVEFSTPILKAASPFPDDPLTVSCELVREDGADRVMIAAALPESAAEDIGEALDVSKLSVIRIDSLAIGLLRGVWNALGASTGRRFLLMPSVDCLSIIVLDGDLPVAIRAMTNGSELKREVMLSLLEAEDFGGARKLEEIIWIRADDRPAEGLAELSGFAPTREIQVGENAALVGVQERSSDEGAINALPESWRDMLEETRFKRRLTKYLAIAGGVWVLVLAVLFGVPVVYGFMTDHQKSLSKQHQRQYQSVKDMKEKVKLIRKYSDHARGALEIMKALSDRLPSEITLSSWSYRRDEGVRVVGDSETAEAAYAFKDAMDALSAGEDEDGERIFGTVLLNGPNASKGGYRFDLDCQYGGADGE